MNALLQHGVSAQAQRCPEAVAIVGAATTMRYGALEAKSNRLARLLADLGCRHGDRIGLLMPKVPLAVVAMLAALKIGAAYVPLDPRGPRARLARVLALSECRCVLAAGPGGRMLTETLADRQLLPCPPLLGWLDRTAWSECGQQPTFVLRDLDAYPARPRDVDAADQDIAHILFTSGSTGLPKGVKITHRSAVAFIRWATSYFGTAPGERISHHPPLHFDLSTFDIFGTLTAGAQLVMVPPELNLMPHRLARFIRANQLTQWFSVPSALNLMAHYDVLASVDLPALRRVLFAGEVLPTATLIYWMRRVPHARFTNLYGPTETTVASSYYTVPACPDNARAPIPIGRACAGEEMLVLDEAMRPLAPGEVGELYIGGVGVSPGYWRDPERTRAAFLSHPAGGTPAGRIYRTGDLAHRDASGLLHFHGRRDTQVKSRGYRIELGEVEAALQTLPVLRESAVVALESGGFEGSLLCCAYAPGDPGIATGDVRARLATLLPAYMLPARWMRFDELPKNANGKVDRPRLRAAFRATHNTAQTLADAVRSVPEPGVAPLRA